MNSRKLRILGLLWLLLLIPLLSYNQSVTYDKDIKLPDEDFRSSPSIDIILADNYLYIYTLKNIIIYQQDENGLTNVGSIDFGKSFGRFAPMYFDHILYAPDSKFMTHDSLNHILYFVTPDLSLEYVNTDFLDTVSNVISLPPDNYPENMTLHAYSKLEFDVLNQRLFWLVRTLDDNLHSFDAYFGIYNKTGNSWEKVYSESLDGSLNNLNLINTFTINTINSDVYLARKYIIEQRSWNSTYETYELIDTIKTPAQERNSKMIFIKNKNLLLVFPFLLNSFNYLDKHIYQIDIRTSLVNKILSPSRKILDAKYIKETEDLILCYADDSFRQIQTDIDHDIAVYHLNSDGNNQIFELSSLISTNYEDEIDVEVENLNRPFKLIKSINGNLIVSKKNEIVLLKSQGASEYNVEHISYSRDNYFNAGVADSNGVSYILNLLSSGFEIIDSTYAEIENIRTAYPVYNIVYNPQNRKLFFFNRLAAEKTGFFIYDLNTEEQVFMSTDRAIGDLIYNPVNNHILISEYGPDEGPGAVIKVYDENMNLFKSLQYFAFDYPGRMFYAPNNKIYLSLNMHADSKMPKLKVIDAENYVSLATISIGLENEIDNISNTFQSFFCYNPYNDCVYATFSPYYQNNVFQPYQTSYNNNISNSIFPFESEPLNDYDGKLLRLNKNNMVQRLDIGAPSEIICANGLSDENNGILYINTKSGLKLFDCSNNSFVELQGGNIPFVFDMDYCPLDNTVLAYSYEQISVIGNPDQYKIHIFKVKEDGSYVEIWTKLGLASSISFNKYDSKLYVYFLGEAELLGEEYTKVFILDPLNENNSDPTVVTLPYKSLFPEVKPQSNFPFFDAYNKAYFPNGTHSSVSVLNFTAKEPLDLDSTDWNWVSFPRTINHPSTNSKMVVEDNIQPFQVDQARLFNLPFGESSGSEVWMTYSGNQWDVSGGLVSIYNTRGYKLNIDKDNLAERKLYLEGTLINENSKISRLYPYSENWVGYWLQESQDVFDAIDDVVLSDLYVIKAQDWTCVRDDQIQGAQPYWICDDNNTVVNYGEMLILKTYRDNYNFRWNNSNKKNVHSKLKNKNYFSYQVDSDYTPIIVELDSSDKPIEIGAFVGDKCVGASLVEPGEHKIVIRAYLSKFDKQCVTFEKYYGLNKKNIKVNNYSVYNHFSNKLEKRFIKSNEKADYIRVVTNNKKYNDKTDDNSLQLNIYPNPVENKFDIEFYLIENSEIKIKIIDINGKLVSKELKTFAGAGPNSMTININKICDEKLQKGVYVLIMEINKKSISRKLIIK